MAEVLWEAPKQGSGTAEDASWPARGCVHGPPWDRASTQPFPSGGTPAREETAPSCTAEKPPEGLESTSPLLQTHAHMDTRLPKVSPGDSVSPPAFAASTFTT